MLKYLSIMATRYVGVPVRAITDLHYIYVLVFIAVAMNTDGTLYFLYDRAVKFLYD